jgi:hypothetical protein
VRLPSFEEIESDSTVPARRILSSRECRGNSAVWGLLQQKRDGKMGADNRATVPAAEISPGRRLKAIRRRSCGRARSCGRKRLRDIPVSSTQNRAQNRPQYPPHTLALKFGKEERFSGHLMGTLLPAGIAQGEGVESDWFLFGPSKAILVLEVKASGAQVGRFGAITIHTIRKRPGDRRLR